MRRIRGTCAVFDTLFHPDSGPSGRTFLTVGSGFTPDLPFGSRAWSRFRLITAGGEFHPAPKMFNSIVHRFLENFY